MSQTQSNGAITGITGKVGGELALYFTCRLASLFGAVGRDAKEGLRIGRRLDVRSRWLRWKMHLRWRTLSPSSLLHLEQK